MGQFWIPTIMFCTLYVVYVTLSFNMFTANCIKFKDLTWIYPIYPFLGCFFLANHTISSLCKHSILWYTKRDITEHVITFFPPINEVFHQVLETCDSHQVSMWLSELVTLFTISQAVRWIVLLVSCLSATIW